MLVLASASPRRKELLTQAGFSFRVIPSSVPEVAQPGEEPLAFATRLSLEKAKAVFREHVAELDLPDDPLLVLGADTVVVSETEILGKPRDPDDAARILRLLSGKTHQVITGVSVVCRMAEDTAAELTYVSMLALTEDEIAAYIASGDPMDKAGAYAIQGYAARWIPRIQGCYFNVVGLPIALATSLIDGMRARLDNALRSPAHVQPL